MNFAWNAKPLQAKNCWLFTREFLLFGMKEFPGKVNRLQQFYFMTSVGTSHSNAVMWDGTERKFRNRTWEKFPRDPSALSNQLGWLDWPGWRRSNSHTYPPTPYPPPEPWNRIYPKCLSLQGDFKGQKTLSTDAYKLTPRNILPLKQKINLLCITKKKNFYKNLFS